ncbi:unnamed protein product, partial [Ectocarpus fasciculatus]
MTTKLLGFNTTWFGLRRTMSIDHSMKCSSDRSCCWETGAATTKQKHNLPKRQFSGALNQRTRSPVIYQNFNQGCLQQPNRNIVLSSNYRTPNYVKTAPARSLYTCGVRSPLPPPRRHQYNRAYRGEGERRTRVLHGEEPA